MTYDACNVTIFDGKLYTVDLILTIARSIKVKVVGTVEVLDIRKDV
jgi:hypothetical protein